MSDDHNWFRDLLVIKVFQDITDKFFGPREKEKAAEKQFERQKELEKIKHKNQKDLETLRQKNRTDEQQQAYESTIAQIKERGKIEKKVQEREHKHQDEKQERDYEHRFKLNEQTHDQRMSEIGYKYSLDRENIILSSQLNIIRDLINRQANHENAKDLEEFRVALGTLDRQIKRAEQNSPFLDVFPERLLQQYAQEIKSRQQLQPLILTAPFFYNNYPFQIQKEGGFKLPTFNDAIDQAIEDKLSQIVVNRDGYLRTLFHGKRDIDHILPYLANIPTILIHGRVLNEKVVEPIVTIWNLPGCLENSPRHFPIGSFVTPALNSGELINFQNALAQKIMELAGMLSDAYHLVINGKRPNLRRYLDDTEQMKLLADELDFYYQLIYEAQPHQEPIYRLEQAMMLGECGLAAEAHEQADQALVNWMNQRTNDFSLDFNLVMELAQKDDLQFLETLLNIYDLANSQGRVAKIREIMQLVQESKFEPIDWFVYPKK